MNIALWAKKNKDKYLPLYIHLHDAYKVSCFLWDNWLSESQKALINKSINDNIGKNLLMFLAYTHDIGKATPAFQSKIGSIEIDLPSINKSPHNISGRYILEKNNINEDIASIISSHHGLPINNKKIIKEQVAYPENYDNENKNYEDIQKEIIDKALDISNFKNIESLPKIKQEGQVILTGLIIMADWIASNEDYFPLINFDEGDRKIDLDKRADIGFNKWLKTKNIKKEKVEDINKDFEKRFGFNPNTYQEIFIKTIEKSIDSGIFIFEAPMGIGKTEAALYGVEQLIQKKDLNGMFFGLPTQATSNGVFTRVKEWLDSFSKDTNSKSGLRLLHGKASLNEDFKSLASNIDTDNKSNHNIFINEWFSGRKSAIMDDFVVGTIDQLLLMSLKQKHLFLRHLGFSRKVVVIDEVHAYDTYMDQYLEKSLRWLGAYNIPVIILSATLPANKGDDLIKSYMKGKGLKDKDIVYDEKIDKVSYPLITYNDESIIKYEYNFSINNTKKYNIIKYEEKSLDTLLNKLFNIGGNIGIIVNTVGRAQNLTKSIQNKFGKEYVHLIHSRFIDTDRVIKEKELLSMVGKNANRPKVKFYVGTQVMEQSLDIDFDVLITDLCPIDLLIQRIGRLHRHKLDRLEEYKKPIVYVLGCNEDLNFNRGSSFIYGNYILSRTQYFLPDKLTIPTDISFLVQEVYSEEDLILNNKLNDKYLKFKDRHLMIINSQKNRAKVFQINNPYFGKREKNIIGWLDGYNSYDDEEKSNAQVRDIKESIEVVVVDKEYVGKEFISYEDSKEIAKKTLKLPQTILSNGIDNIIKELKTYKKENLKFFKNSVWLKNSFGIVLEDGFKLGDFILIYDNTLGLFYKKVEE